MDQRASIKIEFSIYGETFKMDSSINWSVGGEVYEIDNRVIDFFRNSYLDASEKWEAANRQAEQEREVKHLEATERAELARLKAKYEQG